VGSGNLDVPAGSLGAAAVVCGIHSDPEVGDGVIASLTSLIVDKVVIDGDDAVLFSSFSHTVAKNGKRLNTPAALHLTIANGQIVRMHLYEDTLAVHEALSD